MKKPLFIGIQTVIQEAEKHGKAWKVFLIEEGLSKNGKFYPASVLKKAVRLFDKAKAFYYEWKDGEFNHLPAAVQRMRPEGFPRQIAGWYSNPKFEEVEVEGQMKKGITAILHIQSGAKWLKEMLKDAWMNGMRQLLGLSIDADGDVSTGTVQGAPTQVVTAIRKVFGVDLVTHPAAGGQLIRLIASKNLMEGNMDREKLIALIKALRPELLEGVNIEEIKDEDLEKILEKALKEQDDKEDEKKCPKCGKMIPADAIVCPRCKAKLKEQEEDEEAKKLGDRAEKVGLPRDTNEEDIIAKEEELAGKDEEGKVEESIEEIGKAAEIKAKAEGKSEEDIKKLSEAAKGEATLNQVIKLLKAGKTALALNVLQKWLSKYPKGKDEGYPYKEQVDTLLKKFGQLDEKMAIVECNKILDGLLKESKLPEPIKKKVEKRFKNKKFEAKELEGVLKEETDTMAELTSDGDVDLGEVETDIRLGRTGSERIQASLDLMLDPKVEDDEKEIYEGIKGFTSLREAYVKITGDPMISGVIPPKRLQEATTANFSHMLGYTMYRRLARDYKLQPAMWKDLADVVSVKDFKTQEIIRWGGLGNLESFTETDATGTTSEYSDIAFPGDEEATYSAATKGGILKITRKMIINDDLRSLQKLPTKIARMAVKTLNQFVFDLMLSYTSAINDRNIYDSLTLYDTSGKHFNYGTAALDYDSFGDAVDRMREQKETGAKLTGDTTVAADEIGDISFASGATAIFKVGDYVQCEAEYAGPITVVADTYIQVGSVASRGIWGSTAAQHASAIWKVVTDDLMLEPGILWVPTDLRTMAQAILEDEYVEDTLSNRNKYKGICQLRVVPRKFLRGDMNNWYITAKKTDIELIEIGFLMGKQEPELLVQDAPGVGHVFTKDVIRYKIRHEYGGAVIDYRGFQGSIVS